MALKSKKIKTIYLILVLALFLRLIAINQSLWLDEAIGAIAVKKFSYSEIINVFMKADNHPPLYYLLLKFWSNIFGYSEIALRSLSILFSLITIYFTYKLGLLISKNKNAALFASLFLATSQFFVYYSQEARMYVPAAAFSVMSIYFFAKTLQKEYKNINWLYFSLSIAGLVFIDYVPLFMLPVFWIYALFKIRNKKWWQKFIFSHVILAVISLFWFPYFIFQAQNSNYILTKLPEWKNIAGGANFKEAALLWMKFTSGRISLINKKLYYLYVIFASLPFIFVIYKSIKNKLYNNLLICLWFVFPIVSLFAASLFFPGFTYFRLVFVYPAFAILISRALFNKKNKIFIAGLVIIINVISLFVYYSDKYQQREQWRQATSYIENIAEKDALVLFEYPHPFSQFRWYEKGKVDARGALLKITANEPGTNEHVGNLIKNRSIVYHFEYLRDLSDPQRLVEQVLDENGFKVVAENADFVGVGKISKWQR